MSTMNFLSPLFEPALHTFPNCTRRLSYQVVVSLKPRWLKLLITALKKVDGNRTSRLEL